LAVKNLDPLQGRPEGDRGPPPVKGNGVLGTSCCRGKVITKNAVGRSGGGRLENKKGRICNDMQIRPLQEKAI
jgi:hypothetical protein